MKTHQLKTVNPYFQDVWDKRKSFEVRFNDRDFKVRERIILLEYDYKTGIYSARAIVGKIIYILNTPIYCKKGYVIIQLSELKNYKHRANI